MFFWLFFNGLVDQPLVPTPSPQEVPSAAWQLLSPVGTPPVQRGPRAVWSAEADGLFVHGGTGFGDGDLGRGLKGRLW